MPGLGEEKAVEEISVLQRVCNDIHQIASKVEGQARRVRSFYTQLFGPEPTEIDETKKDPKVEPAPMIDKLHSAIAHAENATDELMREIERLENRHAV